LMRSKKDKTFVDEVQKLADYCEEKLDLSEIRLGEEYGYPTLPLCIIDAIFSINANYTSTANTVKRFAAYFDETACSTVQDFVNLHDQYSAEFLVDHVYKNRQRTSTKNGILKAEAVLEVAKVLLKNDVNILEDMHRVASDRAFQTDYKAIRGQASGVSLRYFYMLTGTEAEVKPDRMILRFIETALGRKVDVKESAKLLIAAANLLAEKYPGLNARNLDHTIWRYQRQQ
ncbi:MAG: hypothetical protein KC496_01440, partial [Anaerolineae bacterium]|nr:hypothetical protein [Anaerolineae bacterium]